MRAAWLGLLCAAATSNALACGVCVEDKIAAVYDHAAVTQALGAKHVVVFFAIDGKLVAGERTRGTIEAIARSAPGVDRASVRVSVELASLALAFNAQRTNLATVQSVLDKKLVPMGLSLLAMQVKDGARRNQE